MSTAGSVWGSRSRPQGRSPSPSGATRRPSCGGGSTRRGCRRGRCTRRSSTGGALSLLRLLPATGRTHQLRVHLAAIGHPLAGDWLYGTEDRALIARPALHSYILHLRQPLSGADITVTAPIPGDMTRLIQKEAL